MITTTIYPAIREDFNVIYSRFKSGEKKPSNDRLWLAVKRVFSGLGSITHAADFIYSVVFPSATLVRLIRSVFIAVVLHDIFVYYVNTDPSLHHSIQQGRETYTNATIRIWNALGRPTESPPLSNDRFSIYDGMILRPLIVRFLNLSFFTTV